MICRVKALGAGGALQQHLQDVGRNPQGRVRAVAGAARRLPWATSLTPAGRKWNNVLPPDASLNAESTIRQAVASLALAAQPEQIILFGSHARGTADARSDIDLLVIERKVDDRAAEMVRLRRALRPLPAAFDVLVYSREEVERWGRQPGSALYWALKEGKVMYG